MNTEENNIIEIGDRTIIMNGGNALEGCPKNWDEAKLIEEELNRGKHEDEPQWDFDCGFKLDFDGSLLSVSSRFYPPKTSYGPTWDGRVSIYSCDKKISEKKFDCATLEELKKQVEDYVDSLRKKLLAAIAE